MHRFGVRSVVMVGGVTTAAFTALTGTVRNPLEFGLVFGVALSIADGFMGFIPATTVVHEWFMSRRGVVMGSSTPVPAAPLANNLLASDQN